MIPGLFSNTAISSNKLLSNIDEAKNDAADFMLSQLYPQSFIDLNDFYKLGHQPPSNAQIINHQSPPNSTSPPQQQQQQQQSTSTSSIQQSTASTNNTLNTNATNAQIANTPNETNNIQHYTTQINQPNTPPFITMPGPPPPTSAVVPQFIIDPTGKKQ